MRRLTLRDPVMVKPRIIPPVVYDVDAVTFFAAVTSNSGTTLSDPTKLAVSNFCGAAKGHGYWTLISRINLLCGPSPSCAAVPLKVGSGAATDSLDNWSSYSEAAGLKGNGASSFGSKINTVFKADSLSGISNHLLVYDRSSFDTTTVLNGADGGGWGIKIATNGNDALLGYSGYSYISIQTGDGNTGALGFVGITRTSHVDLAFYQNGGSLGTASNENGTSNLMPHNDIWIGNCNDGQGSAATSHYIGGYSIGTGLTSTQMSSFYSDMQAFQTALGRAV